jgi:ribosome biogenesis GTPase
MPQGTVLSAVGGVYEVELADGGVIEAVLRGRLKRDEKADDRIVSGDDVQVTLQETAWTIESVAPRRSQLTRRAPGAGRRRPKTIAANIDRILIVFAAARPDPNARMLDRLLVLAEANQLDVLIVINKADLAGDGAPAAFLAPYHAAGYATLVTSVAADRGIAELRTLLCGARSALTGPSGVGKSSLLNAVQPGLGLRIGAVSDAVNKGRHTTVAARLIPLECGGYVADTPGLREVGMWAIDVETLDSCFPEFREYIGTCRYARSCSHTHEPGCAVRDAVDTGAISRARYESYALLYAE